MTNASARISVWQQVFFPYSFRQVMTVTIQTGLLLQTSEVWILLLFLYNLVLIFSEARNLDKLE